MISTTNVKTNVPSTGKYIGIGRHELKINEITTTKSSNGQSTQVTFKVETSPITTEGFQPVEGAKGQVGTVKTIYLKTDEQINEFVSQIALLADKLGVRTEIDSVQASNLEEYIEKVSPLLTNKYFWGRVVGEQYVKNDGSGKIGTILHWSRYKAFNSLKEVEEKGIEVMKAVDPSNTNDLRPPRTTDTTSQQATGSVF